MNRFRQWARKPMTLEEAILWAVLCMVILFAARLGHDLMFAPGERTLGEAWVERAKAYAAERLP